MSFRERVVLDVVLLYGTGITLEVFSEHLEHARLLAKGDEVVLARHVPIWLCPAAAHTLHGIPRRLRSSPVTTGELLIFN
ncbi:MAG: hypothetical protein RMK93_08655, partial [Bacteroidota bacterium]|nr:hypothetical protein [Bacteroidota bacterium]